MERVRGLLPPEGNDINLIARPDQHMRREEPSREPVLMIRLFGGMSIRDSRDTDYLPRSRKTRALVAVLALTSPRPVTRIHLTGLLWSQRQKEQGRASLRQAIHELQETLGPIWSRILVAERHHLAMDTQGVIVDVLAATEPSADRADLLTLLQKGFLEDLNGADAPFDDWIARERNKLLSLARAAGQAILRESTENQTILSAARALLRIDPAHGGAWRSLVQAHLDTGDRAAAVFACEQWREAAGISPDDPAPAEMAALLDRLRSGTAAQRRGGPETVRPRRSGLRLGIREMRLLGSETDASLSVGLAEEVTTALSRFRWISCVSGASLAVILGEPDQGNPHHANPRGSEIDLDMILEGTIQRGGEHVRITVRLLDMRLGGEVIWANRFDRTGVDALTIQDEVGAAIVAQVDPALLIREGERVAGRRTPGASPGELVLQAVPAIYRLDRTAFHAAGELLEAALHADPGLAVGHAWYAYWHLFLVGQGWADDPEAAANRAATLADTAVALDPGDARAVTLAGHVRGYLMKRVAEADRMHERAISLNPNLALAWCFSGLTRCYLGDHEGAIKRIRQAILLSPSDPHLFFFETAIMIPRLLRGEYEIAAAAGRASIELNPWFSSSFKGYLSVLGFLGWEREAADVRARLLKLEPGFTVRDAIRRAPIVRAEDIAHYAKGLRLAGLPEGDEGTGDGIPLAARSDRELA